MTFSVSFRSFGLWDGSRSGSRCENEERMATPPSSSSPSSSIVSAGAAISSADRSRSSSCSSSSVRRQPQEVVGDDRRQRSGSGGGSDGNHASLSSQQAQRGAQGGGAQQQRRKIVIAIDHSEDSENAVRWAVDHHLRPDDQVTLLHVKRPADALCGPGVYAAFSDSSMAPEAMAEPDLKQQQRLEIATQALSDRLRKLVCGSKAAVKCDPLIVDDLDARERICSEVNQMRADTLIMGSRGMGRVKRLLLGSVSDYCVNHCPCPVVVVRKKAYSDGTSMGDGVSAREAAATRPVEKTAQRK